MSKNSKNTNKNTTTKTDKKVPFQFVLPSKGVDKVEYHEVTGDIKSEKGITNATATRWYVRIRKDGSWESAFKFASDYIASNNASITDEMRKALRDVSGIYGNKSVAAVNAYTLALAVGITLTDGQKASFEKAKTEVEKLAKALEQKTILREAKAVHGGKSRFCEDARDKAGKQFDKLEKSFKGRSQAIQQKALAKVAK